MKRKNYVLIGSMAFVLFIFFMFNGVEQKVENTLLVLKDNQDKYSLTSFLVLSSDIILPIPSSIVMYLNGWVLGFFYGTILSLAASLLSSSIGYFIGGLLVTRRKEVLNKHSAGQSIIKDFGNLSIVLTRGIPILSESMSIVAGHDKVGYTRFLLLNLIGYIPVSAVYAICGSLGYKEGFFLSFAFAMLLSCLLFVISKRLKYKV